MESEQIRALIRQVIEDPSVGGRSADEIDDLIGNVIRIEKRHLYGIHQTTSKRRQEEIQQLIEGYLKRDTDRGAE